MRLSVIATAISLSIVGICTAQNAEAAIRRPTHIAAQGLAPALQLLAKERNVQVVYRSELVRDRRTSGAAGDLTFDEALTQLLSGTGLTYRYLDDKAITIIPVGSPAGSATASTLTSEQAGTTDSAASPHARAGGEGVRDSSEDASKQSLWNRFRLAQVDQGASSGSTPVEKKQSQQTSKEKSVQLEEVIVTAQKRNERLQDVPVPVTAISAQTLVDQNQLRFEDYFSDFPGLNFSSGDRGELYPSIRGLTTGSYTNPTIGIVIDDVPYGAALNFFTAPDIDPSDLARIEVLRGPQGTLYGVSSIGGLIKYVTVDPSTEGVSGRVEAGPSAVHNGAEAGYEFRGAVNVPLSTTVAVRASGFAHQDPGYIDNPITGVRGVNKADSYGGHFSALWIPTETFSLKLSALLQHSKADGNSETIVAPGFGDLQQNILVGWGGYDRDLKSFSATVKAKLGSVDVTSVTGYTAGKVDSSLDLSQVFAPFVKPLFGVSGSAFTQSQPLDKFSQEVRLSGPIGEHLDWLLGGFYTSEHGFQSFQFLANDTVTGVTVGTFGGGTFEYNFREYATFADLTAHFTDRFNVQIGGRQSWDRQPEYAQVYTGHYASEFLGSDPNSTEIAGESAKSFTYLVTPQFKVSPDLMTYLRLASGFRPGGGNNAFAALSGEPATFRPDKTQNYEVGAKGNVLNHTLSLDVSLYRIDWKDVQVLVENAIGNGFTVNAGQAKSQGVDLSIESRPLTGMTITAWAAWNHAQLTQPLPPGGPGTAMGASGDQLPYSTHFSGNLSLLQDFPLRNNVTAFAGGTLTYVGERLGNFQPTPQRQIFPSYAKTDLRAGVRYESWIVNLYVNNVTDKRGVQGGGIDGFPTNAIVYIRPRTAGRTVAKTFR